MCAGFSSAGKKKKKEKEKKGVFTALTNIAALLLASLITPFLNSGTTQQGHFINGNISSFIIYMHVCKHLSVHMYVDVFIGWVTGFV